MNSIKDTIIIKNTNYDTRIRKEKKTQNTVFILILGKSICAHGLL